MASFNGNLWMYLQLKPGVSSDPRSACMGLLHVQVPDPYYDFILRDRWHRSYPELITTKISGEALSVAWLEENYLTASLFGSPQILEIYQGQNIKQEALGLLRDLCEKQLCPGALVVAQGGTTSASRGKKGKGKSNQKTMTPTVVIAAPKFWEMADFFQQLAREWNLNLQGSLMQAILEESGGEIELGYALLHSLSLLPADEISKIKEQEIKLFNGGQRIDKFKVAQLWGEKRWTDLIALLNNMTFSMGEERAIISFVRSHLLKFPDVWDGLAPMPSNAYQRSLATQARKWSPLDWETEMSLLSKMEIDAKTKSPFLWNPLKLRTLSQARSYSL